jgi:hypothetical protein
MLTKKLECLSLATAVIVCYIYSNAFNSETRAATANLRPDLESSFQSLETRQGSAR